MSEPVVVAGSPTLRLNTGAHFEKGAEHAVATFLGGGYGEKKTFWKNNERNPMKNPMEANNWYEDLYHVRYDGGCTEELRRRAAPRDCVTLSDNGVCDCAHYSGVTKTTASAELRTRRTHTFQPGDLVIVQGVTGPDASLLNKQHTVGAVRASGSGAVSRTDAGVSRGDGNDIITFYPPLDLRGRSFDASQAVVGRANIEERVSRGCREGRHQTRRGVLSLQRGHAISPPHHGQHPSGPHAIWTAAPGSARAPRHRKHRPRRDDGFVRGRGRARRDDAQGISVQRGTLEQYMDNVLAFEFTVEGYVRVGRCGRVRSIGRERR